MSKMHRLTCLVLVIWLITTGVWVKPTRAAERPIYVVQDWQTYLQLVPVSVRDGYTPLLYHQEADLTPAIRHFAELYNGSLQVLDAEGVQQVVAAQWPRAETIVVAEKQSRLGMMAAAIAAELESPLFFALPAETELQRLQVRRVIAVGAVTLPVHLEGILLRDLEEAQHYYNTLVGERPVAVLARESKMEFLAAGVAAYHRGPLLLAPNEIQDHRPQYLAWVTSPRSVTRQRVYALYEACRVSPGSRAYDVGVGILTGLTPHDVSLLMARAYTYPELGGEWKTRAVAASDVGKAFQTSQTYPLDVVSLSGKALTGEALLEAMRGAGYVWVLAHGTPSSLVLSDGGWPVVPSNIADLPPLVFVAEACKTGDIGGEGIDHSLALHIVAGGAVAYIGSMDMGGVGLIGRYPYALSTPSTPLGTLVRLQNAARMDVDADAPRVILIGDPTFHRFEREWVHYEAFFEKDSVRVRVQEQSAIDSAGIVVELPDAMPVRYAQVQQGEARNTGYMPGMIYADRPLGRALRFERPLSSVLTFGRTTVLLEWSGGDGELVLYPQQPLRGRLHRILADGFAGIQGIFIDLLAQPILGVPLAGASVLLMLRYIWTDRKRVRVDSLWWTGILAGIGMSLLGILYSLGMNFAVPWLVVVIVGCWATTVTWSISPHWHEWTRIAQCVGLYIAPLMPVWLLVVVLGMSQRGLVLMTWGGFLTSIAYGLMLLASIALVNKMVKES